MTTPISSSAAAARDDARQTNGEFGTQARADVSADVDLVSAPAAPDYSTWEPVEIDTELSRLDAEHANHMGRYAQAMGYVSNDVARKLNRGFRGKATRDEIRDAVALLKAAKDSGEYIHPNDSTMIGEYDRAQRELTEAARVQAEADPFNEEFDARGGWTRAFHVTNVGGHIHKSMDCHTCFRPGWDNSGNWREGTTYYWRTELSDHDESEVIEKAGSIACTACYPHAPSEVLNRPTQLFTPDQEAKAKARDERAQAKLERDAKKIANAATPDGSELVVNWGNRWPEHIKTEREATRQAVDKIVDHTYGWLKDRGPMPPEVVAGVETIIESLAEKHGKDVEEIRSEFEKKATAKAKRDGYPV